VQGVPEVQNALAKCLSGDDMVEAARLYGQVAEQGRAVAQNMLGMFYMLGCGELHSNQDLDAAARLFRLAADQGEDYSQYWLAYFCECGNGGVNRDMAEAVRWYRAAAEQGNTRAIAQLGVLREMGRGVARSEEMAAASYAAASALGAEELFAACDATPRELSAVGSGALQLQLVIRDLALAGRLAYPGAVEKLAAISSRREFAFACCMGCGATRGLKSCAQCRVARFCVGSCTRRMWPAHKPSCKAWAEQAADVGLPLPRRALRAL